MRKLGIIQPGKIGDIIICLPIAKWYSDKGYKIIWPIDKKIINNFLGYIDYVEFIPIDFDCRLAHQVCFNNFCSKVIDLSFTIPGANNFNTENYLNQDTYTFDEFKYFLADVPFEEKWKLVITRNKDKENELFNLLVKQESYVTYVSKTSDGNRDDVKYNEDLQIITIDSLTESVFDWIKILENSTKQIIVDSCFVNLIEQLDISCKDTRYLLLRNGYYGKKLKDGYWKGKPRVKMNWIEI